MVCFLFEVSLPHEGRNLVRLVYTVSPWMDGQMNGWPGGKKGVGRTQRIWVLEWNVSEHTQDRPSSGNESNLFSFSFDSHSRSQEPLYQKHLLEYGVSTSNK